MLFCLVFLSFLEKGEGWRLLEVIESGEREYISLLQRVDAGNACMGRLTRKIARHPLRRKELAFFTVSCVAHGGMYPIVLTEFH